MIKVLAFIGISLACVLALEGDHCTRDDMCGENECCSHALASKRQLVHLNLDGVPGFCKTLKDEGESCHYYSSCSCKKGLECVDNNVYEHAFLQGRNAKCVQVQE